MRLLLPEAREVDDDDLWSLYALPDAPSSRAGFVASVDGAVAVDGSSRPLSGPADRAVFRTLRAVSDVVLVGAGTAREEDYGPVPLPEALRRRRSGEGRPPRPALAVASRSLDLDPSARLFSEPSQRLLLLAPSSARAPRGLPEHVEVVRVDDGPAGLVRALQDRGLPRVLCEGGPDLLGGLLADGGVDELCLTTAPLLVGGAPGLLPAALPAPAAARLVSLLEDDGVLLARWALQDAREVRADGQETG
jgi:riboflavin biosynthesis pyrimidine reductase